MKCVWIEKMINCQLIWSTLLPFHLKVLGCAFSIKNTHLRFTVDSKQFLLLPTKMSIKNHMRDRGSVTIWTECDSIFNKLTDTVDLCLTRWNICILTALQYDELLVFKLAVCCSVKVVVNNNELSWPFKLLQKNRKVVHQVTKSQVLNQVPSPEL